MLKTRATMQMLSLVVSKTRFFRNITLVFSCKRNIASLQNYPKLSEYVYKNKIHIKNGNNQENNDDATMELLKNCFRGLAVGQSTDDKLKKYEELLHILHEDGFKLEIGHYNYYLKACLNDRRLVNIEEFVRTMQVQPNSETLNLILELTCEQGNVRHMLEILNIMKENGIAFDGAIFNNIILCHTINGGLEASKNAMKTLKHVDLAENENTVWFLLKGTAISKNKQEFQDVLKSKSITFNITLFLNLLHVLCNKDIVDWHNMILNALKMEKIPGEYARDLELFCYQLINENNVNTSMKLYYALQANVGSNNNYGINLLKKMLQTKQSFTTVVNMALELKDKNYNPYAMERITEFALKEKYYEGAWVLLQNFTEKRTHYFWPLLINSKNSGEVGILKTMDRMLAMNVKFDAETLEQYCVKFLDLSNPTETLRKLQKLGFANKELVPPLLITLLQHGKIERAYNFYREHRVPMLDSKISNNLAVTWHLTNASKHISLILQEICEASDKKLEFVGTFLVHALKKIRRTGNLNQYYNLIMEIKGRNLMINNASSDEIFTLLKTAQSYKRISDLEQAVEKLIDITLNNSKSPIPHPRNMNLEELECHLIELQSKQMETRGVIRKLIQAHIQNKNYKRVQDLRTLFIESGYVETPGMVSASFYTYLKNNDVEEATKCYNEIKTAYPKFCIDTYKILDFVEALIKNEKLDDAISILRDESKNNGNLDVETVQRNCINVLNACNNIDELNIVFKSLTEYKYCNVTNLTLGPLIRIHLKNGDIKNAVISYQKFAKEYRFTPLQYELLLQVVKESNHEYFADVIEATESVHGHVSTQNALVGALAESGLELALKNIFMSNSTVPMHLLEKRCERWVFEQKVAPLKTLLNVVRQLPRAPVNVDLVCLSIINIYSLKNDAAGALEFWMDLEEKEINPSKKLQDEYDRLLKRCKHEASDEIK